MPFMGGLVIGMDVWNSISEKITICIIALAKLELVLLSRVEGYIILRQGQCCPVD